MRKTIEYYENTFLYTKKTLNSTKKIIVTQILRSCHT
jgi:hypothetical protein